MIRQFTNYRVIALLAIAAGLAFVANDYCHSLGSSALSVRYEEPLVDLCREQLSRLPDHRVNEVYERLPANDVRTVDVLIDGMSHPRIRVRQEAERSLLQLIDRLKIVGSDQSTVVLVELSRQLKVASIENGVRGWGIVAAKRVLFSRIAEHASVLQDCQAVLTNRDQQSRDENIMTVGFESGGVGGVPERRVYRSYEDQFELPGGNVP